MPVRWPRVAAVTAALVVAGFAAGTVLGAALVVGIGLAQGEVAPLAHLPGVLALCALAGGPIGALATPVLAWGLLRRVPLGRALAATTAGTLLGGVLPARAAGLLGAHEAALFVAVPGALLGFAAAAVWVRARAAGARGGPASAA